MINEDFTSKTKLQDLGRWYVTSFVKHLGDNLASGTKLLDAGAGESVYRRYFEHCDYKSIDLGVGENRWDYGHLDFVAPLHEMPIESDTFDVVLCTQVLEHLELPRESVKEMYRVLKPGGMLAMTVPMAHKEHQVPYDFFRYTSYGLRSICSHAGFREVTVEPFGGIGARWAYEMPHLLKLIPPSGLRTGNITWIGLAFSPLRVLARWSLPLMQSTLLRMDRFDEKKDFPLGWCCRAIK